MPPSPIPKATQRDASVRSRSHVGGGADRLDPLAQEIAVPRSAGAVGGTRQRQPRRGMARPR